MAALDKQIREAQKVFREIMEDAHVMWVGDRLFKSENHTNNNGLQPALALAMAVKKRIDKGKS